MYLEGRKVWRRDDLGFLRELAEKCAALKHTSIFEYVDFGAVGSLSDT